MIKLALTAISVIGTAYVAHKATGHTSTRDVGTTLVAAAIVGGVCTLCPPIGMLYAGATAVNLAEDGFVAISTKIRERRDRKLFDAQVRAHVQGFWDKRRAGTSVIEAEFREAVV